MNSSRIYSEISNGIGELILNKPEKRNALSSDMWGAIPELIAEFQENRDVKTVIIHGGTAGAFAAGADISEFESIYATAESAANSADLISNALTSIAECRKPVIAAIDGGGVSVAPAADIRVAGEGSRFAVTPAKLGLVYPVDDTRRLIEAVGVPAAKDILLTGRLFLTEEAFRLGLVTRMVAAGEALATARTLAEQIGQNSLWSHGATKRSFKAVNEGWTDKTAEAKALFLESFSNEDFEEGYTAFLGKRLAKFTYR